MNQTKQNLYGYWRVAEIHYRHEDGSWGKEEVYGGSCVFTESGHINTFVRTSDLASGYTGRFVLRGDVLLITPEVSSIQQMEGKMHARTIKDLSSEAMTIAMVEEATGRQYEILLKILEKKVSSIELTSQYCL